MNTRSAVLIVISGIIAVLTSALLAQDNHTFEPLDRGFGYRFDYPMQTHSVRTSNLMQPAKVTVPFGALISLEPNDSYLYADAAQPTLSLCVQRDGPGCGSFLVVCCAGESVRSGTWLLYSALC